MDEKRDALIRIAILQRRLIRLRYLGKDRIVEPHGYGIQKGIIKLLAYQVGGVGRGQLPTWRWFAVGRNSNVLLMD